MLTYYTKNRPEDSCSEKMLYFQRDGKSVLFAYIATDDHNQTMPIGSKFDHVHPCYIQLCENLVVHNHVTKSVEDSKKYGHFCELHKREQWAHHKHMNTFPSTENRDDVGELAPDANIDRKVSSVYSEKSEKQKKKDIKNGKGQGGAGGGQIDRALAQGLAVQAAQEAGNADAEREKRKEKQDIAMDAVRQASSNEDSKNQPEMPFSTYEPRPLPDLEYHPRDAPGHEDTSTAFYFEGRRTVYGHISRITNWKLLKLTIICYLVYAGGFLYGVNNTDAWLIPILLSLVLLITSDVTITLVPKRLIKSGWAVDGETTEGYEVRADRHVYCKIRHMKPDLRKCHAFEITKTDVKITSPILPTVLTEMLELLFLWYYRDRKFKVLDFVVSVEMMRQAGACSVIELNAKAVALRFQEECSRVSTVKIDRDQAFRAQVVNGTSFYLAGAQYEMTDKFTRPELEEVFGDWFVIPDQVRTNLKATSIYRTINGLVSLASALRLICNPTRFGVGRVAGALRWLILTTDVAAQCGVLLNMMCLALSWCFLTSMAIGAYILTYENMVIFLSKLTGRTNCLIWLDEELLGLFNLIVLLAYHALVELTLILLRLPQQLHIAAARTYQSLMIIISRVSTLVPHCWQRRSCDLLIVVSFILTRSIWRCVTKVLPLLLPVVLTMTHVAVLMILTTLNEASGFPRKLWSEIWIRLSKTRPTMSTRTYAQSSPLLGNPLPRMRTVVSLGSSNRPKGSATISRVTLNTQTYLRSWDSCASSSDEA
jgi:hypothetical protein